MKTTTLVIAGMMIIALTALTVPVLAGTPGDVGGGATGDQDTNATLALNNASADFGIFAIGENLISASNDKAFPEVVVASNEAAWSVSLWANPNPMQSGSYALANSLQVRNEMGTITGITNDLETFTDISTSSGSQTKLMNGTPIYQSNVTLAFRQDIIPIDTAANDYATVLTLTYASNA